LISRHDNSTPVVSFMSLQAMLAPRSPSVHITFGRSSERRNALLPMPTVRLSVLPPSNEYGPIRSKVSSLT